MQVRVIVKKSVKFCHPLLKCQGKFDSPNELVPGHQVGGDFHHLSVIFENPVTVYQASHLNFKLLCIIMCKGGKDFNS